MQIQRIGLTFLLRNNPRIGTIRIYRVVKKPALPTLEYIIPYCCTKDARQTDVPQRSPPTISFFEKNVLFSLWGPLPIVFLFFFIMANETGVRTTTASQELKHKNVKLPISSRPLL